jgi:magnesium chelatase family protein
MLAILRTFALMGIAAREVTVEVDVRGGLPAFSVVGLPDAAVRESRDRVRPAIANCGFNFPQERITVSLAPADLPKAGPAFDLAIAAGVLVASSQLSPSVLERSALAGELALDGTVKPIAGALAMADEAGRRGIDRFFVPAASAPEAALAGRWNGARSGPRVLPIERLTQLRAIEAGEEPPAAEPPELDPTEGSAGAPDLADLRGQPMLRLALEVAAAGGHGLLMVGPPGAGKSLAASRLPSLIPPLSRAEALDVIRVAGACGSDPLIRAPRRPFRAPHHTISAAGLIGGGNPPRPGEVTRAHRGVLFLDELGEFARDALEALRQPLEEGRVVISRSRHSIELPCRFLLVAAANPCPCGRGEDSDDCRCDPAQVRRYGARLSGALADRIDISLAVSQPPAKALAGPPGEGSAKVRERVAAARARQAARLGQGRVNAEMTPAETRMSCRLDRAAREQLAAGHRRLALSGRGHERVLRLARTIADLEESEPVQAEHVTKALMLRRRADT